MAFAQVTGDQCDHSVEKDLILSDVHNEPAMATEFSNTIDDIFQAMTEGTTVLNQDGEVLVRNNAASRFLGIPINSTANLKALLQRFPTRTLHGQPLSEEEFP